MRGGTVVAGKECFEGACGMNGLSGEDLSSKWRTIESNVREIMEANSRLNEQDRFFKYPLALATYEAEEVMGALESMASFRTTMWSKTLEFEKEFASRFGSSQAVMVNSGSSADLLIAFALRDPRFGGLGVGDEVLAPAVTWPTQIWSFVMAGFRVKLVDVDPTTLNMSVEDLEAKIGPRTRAISIVHLMGNTTDLDKVQSLAKKYGLVIVEDSCEALGTKWRDADVGSFGLASSSSFFFSHHITTMEGGMITTSSEELAEHLRLLRAHGWTRNLQRQPDLVPGMDARYTFADWGFNVRPTELSAAFGMVQLGRFDGYQGEREHAASYALERIKEMEACISPMLVKSETTCSWFAFPIMVNLVAPFSRDDLVAHLEKHGIETRPIVAGNLGRQPAMEKVQGVSVGELPGADEIHRRGFYLGLHPSATMRNEFERVWDVISVFVGDRV